MTHEEKTKYDATRKFFEKSHLCTVQKNSNTRIDLTTEQLTFLLTEGMFERASTSALGLGMHIFTNPEVMKKRYRLIVHTIDINDQTPDDAESTAETKVLFTPLNQSITNGLNNWYTWTNDIKSYYQHFKLDPTARPYFAFDSALGPLQLTSIATGQRQCVALAQIASQTIMRHAVETSMVRDAIHETYIDNFKVHHEQMQPVHDIATAFHTACDQAGLSLNDELESAIQTMQAKSPYDYRGLTFTPGKRAILAEKTQRKLLLAEEMLTNVDQWTLRDTQEVFGLCVYAAMALNMATAPYYYVYKLFRRRQREHNETSPTAGRVPARLWPSVIPVWHQWTQDLRLGERKPRQAVKDITVVTDASLMGYGGYVFEPGKHMQVVSGTWFSERNQSIMELEARALFITLSETIRQGSTVTVIVDNTSVKGALAKGRSKNFRLNELINSIATGWCITEIHYIKSELNPADGLSRGKSPLHQLCVSSRLNKFWELGQGMAGRSEAVEIPPNYFVPITASNEVNDCRIVE